MEKILLLEGWLQEIDLEALSEGFSGRPVGQRNVVIDIRETVKALLDLQRERVALEQG